jgi:c-di-GMP-binding flagellar brake protein YcgR
MSATPRIGSGVRIRSGHGDSENYKSKVADVDDDFLYIDIPVNSRSGKEIDVRIDEDFFVEYAATETEVYRYTSTMLGIAYIPTPTVRLLNPLKAKNLERVQRREFFRISLDTLVTVFREGAPQPYHWQASDISGGGLAVKTKEKVDFSANELVKVSVKLPYVEYQLNVPCRIIRCEVGEDGAHHISMAFENIKERERDQVVRYTFMKQRAMKK